MPTKSWRKLFYIVGILTLALFFIGDSYKFTFLWILVIPFLLFALIAVPVALVTSFSQDVGVWFVRFHKFRNKNKGIYTFETIAPSKASVWKFPLKIIALTIAIFYNVLNWTGNLKPAFSDFSVFRVPIDVILISLCIASVVNVTIYILTRTGIMFETYEDKSKINLGRELSGQFNWAVSPTAFLTLGYYIITKSNLVISIPEITDFLWMCAFSAFLSFIVLRKLYFEKMVNDLTSKLKKLLNH
jgi:hypothetical protein